MTTTSSTAAARTLELAVCSTVFAICREQSIASAMCSAPLSLDPQSERPPAGAIGQTVMIASGDEILGCALLTGVVTVDGEPDPDSEHPSAPGIRQTLGSGGASYGPFLWVFVDGLWFDAPVRVDGGGHSGIFAVPESLEAVLYSARQHATASR